MRMTYYFKKHFLRVRRIRVMSGVAARSPGVGNLVRKYKLSPVGGVWSAGILGMSIEREVISPGSILNF